MARSAQGLAEHSMNPFLTIHPHVQAALSAGQPVVALESTIISHGMPYPDNLETARAVEDMVRRAGAVPATVALMDGRIRIGLDPEQLHALATDRRVIKASRRDIPHVLSQRLTGATTVAATMICAEMAGIRVFATGGIGGVHRGGQDSMDVSADLQELARASVAVVCAGAKSILDLGRTLEYLETHGVPVVGYRTDEFPAFYTRSSGYGVDCRLDTPAEVAALLHTKWSLGLAGGVVIANPAPESHAWNNEEMDALIDQALAAAETRGVTGKEVTPFLLAWITEHTDGRSLTTNIALIEHNARVAAGIAGALAMTPGQRA
jgi:pseudouridylate synthase